MSYRSVTVGITAYNALSTIQCAIDSALSQTYPVSEVIIVDDCSTDGTLDVLANYERRHEIVKILPHDINRGVAAARNTIIENASSEFLVFFDDDDYSVPDRVECQLNAILKFGRVMGFDKPVVCHSARLQKFSFGESIVAKAMGEEPGLPIPSGMPVFRKAMLGEPLVNSNGSCATCSQMARLSLYRKFQGFDERFRRCEDFEFAMRLAIEGGYFLGVGEILVEQTMTATEDKNLDAVEKYTLLILSKHREKFNSSKEYGLAVAWLRFKFSFLKRETLSSFILILRLLFCSPVFVLSRFWRSLQNLKLNLVFKKFSR